MNERFSPVLPTRRLWLHAAAGLPIGCACYFAAMVLVIGIVPRTAEGVRSLVAIPWRAYAILPTLLAAFLGSLIGLIPARSCTARMVFFFAIMGAIAVCTLLGIEVLERDFTGKL